MLTSAATKTKVKRRRRADVGVAAVLAMAAVVAVMSSKTGRAVDLQNALVYDVIETRALPSAGPIAQIN